MGRLLLLFVLLPAVELYLLIRLGAVIGPLTTIALIVVTGVVGATLARSQGLRVYGNVQRELNEGRMPASSMLDGLIILIAAALLVTPGILTDAFGFLCLNAGFREFLKRWLLQIFERAIADSRVHVHVEGFGVPPGDPEISRSGDGPIIDIDPASDESVKPVDRR